MTIVLGLDLGVNIGWFRGGAVGPCEWGTFILPTTDPGHALQASDTFFRKHLADVDELAIEMPYMGDNVDPAVRLFGLLTHAMYWWRLLGKNPRAVHRVNIQTAKMTLSGNHKADKDEMIRAAALRGYEGMTQHEADALACWWVIVFGAAPTKAERDRAARLARRTTTP